MVKNEQVAIAKSGIDRIEARPPAKKGGGKKVVSETHLDDPAKPSTGDGPQGPVARPQLGAPGTPHYSSSGGIVFSDDREFSTVYRRSSGAPISR